jgi:hypothetical protein
MTLAEDPRSESDLADLTHVAVIHTGPAVNAPIQADPDFLALADLCTAFGVVQSATDLEPLLRDATRILDARGLIVWLCDRLDGELRPALVHGYSEQVLAQSVCKPEC